MKQMKILLADDDKDDRYFFSKALTETGVASQLISVEDGEKLMNYLAAATDLPDVIFLDLNMPRKTGAECLTEIKQNRSYRDIPVVIYSTSIPYDAADVLYEKGAQYCLQKCVYSELPSALYKVLELLSNSPKRPARDQFIIRTLVA